MEGCPNPDTSGGQWAFIPEEYCEQHGLDFGVACSCKRAGCLRACRKKEPKRAPGRKRTHTAVSPTTTASCIEDSLPRPPTILSIDEVWADRCAKRSHCTPRPRPPRPLLTVAARCGTCGGGRCVDIEEMGEVPRGNKLPHARSHALEYAIHGKWKRTASDENGTHGCWYIGVLQVVETFGADAVNAKLAAYEAAQAAARAEAVAAAATLLAEEAVEVAEVAAVAAV